MSTSRFILLLSILMLLGLAFFLAGPKIRNEDLIESYKDEFTLEPYGNKKIAIPLSSDQAFYLVAAHNLVLKNIVSVEVSSSSLFTLYKSYDNTTIKLAEHTLYYSSNMSETRVLIIFIVKNEGNESISVKTNLKHILTVKITDFTIPHIGFATFITALLVLQTILLRIKRDTLIGSIVTKTVSKFRRESTDMQEYITSYVTIILEISLPILLLFIGFYALVVPPGRDLFSIKYISDYVIDYFTRIILIFLILGYFLAIILKVLELTHRQIQTRILRNENPEALKIYVKALQIYRTKMKILFTLVFIFLVIAIAMFVLDFKLEIILGTAFCESMILYAAMSYVEIKLLQTNSQSNDYNKALADFIKISMITSGFFVLGAIIFFALFTIMMPLFSALTKNLFPLELYPSFIYNAYQSFVSWVNDAFIFFGQIQVLVCLLVTGPYWITRVIAWRLDLEYGQELLKDLLLFVIVFLISAYLTGSHYYFIRKQPYDFSNLPVSLLIGMTTSILKDLLKEVWPE